MIFGNKDHLKHVIEDFMLRYRERVRQSTKLE